MVLNVEFIKSLYRGFDISNVNELYIQRHLKH